jgi:hypothetical protein
MQWQGTITSGEEISVSMVMLIEYVSEPKAQHMQVSGIFPGAEGEAGTAGPAGEAMDIYVVGDTTYMNLFGTWMQVPASEDQSSMGDIPLVTSQDILGGLEGAKYEGRETINGAETKHYSFDEKALGSWGLSPDTKIETAKGDVYIATDGNYMARLDVTMTGMNITVPGGTGNEALTNGSMHMVMDVTDVNKPITIEVPPEALEAGKPPEDIPVLDNAEETTNLFGMISYKTASTPQEVHDFYKAEMPNNGWTETKDEPLGEMFTMEFTKDQRTASLMITTDSDSGKTSVLISISENQ